MPAGQTSESEIDLNERQFIGKLINSKRLQRYSIRDFEDGILDRVSLIQELEVMPAVQALSFCLQIIGYSQSEIAQVGNRHQQGIKYHVDKVKKAMAEGDGD